MGLVLKGLIVSLEAGKKCDVEPGGNVSFSRGVRRPPRRGRNYGDQVVFTSEVGWKPG